MQRLIKQLGAIPSIGLILFLIIGAGASVRFMFQQSGDAIDFKYLSIECSIFDVTGKVIYVRNQSGCAFSNDGRLLTMDPKVLDAHDNTLTGLELYAHHMVKFSKDFQSVLLIEAENILFEGKTVKSDCFSKRDLKFNIINRWCLKDHIDEMKSLGFEFRSTFTDNWDPKYAGLSSQEISHANSIYEISNNKYSSRDLAFEEGNFLINVYGSTGALIIIDREMKKILWHKNMNRFRWPADDQISGYQIVGDKDGDSFIMRVINHDHQVLPDGRILSHITLPLARKPDFLENHFRFITEFFQKKEVAELPLRKHTYAVTWDPFDKSEKIEILYRADEPKSMSVPAGGQVSLLKNGNVFVVDSTDEKSEVFVAGKNGKILWRFPYPKGEGSGQPHFLHAKPLYDEGFLTSRGLN